MKEGEGEEREEGRSKGRESGSQKFGGEVGEEDLFWGKMESFTLVVNLKNSFHVDGKAVQVEQLQTIGNSTHFLPQLLFLLPSLSHSREQWLLLHSPNSTTLSRKPQRFAPPPSPLLLHPLLYPPHPRGRRR